MRARSLGCLSLLVMGLVVLASLPALVAGTATEPPSCASAVPDDLDAILVTIRTIESGDNYTASARGSSGSGAYGFLDSSWADYGGYPRAMLAPPDVQDAKAAELVGRILASNQGDVAAVSVSWYLGHVPKPGSPEWDSVPSPSAGNRFTPRQYQTKWLALYRSMLTDLAADPTADATEPGLACTESTSTTAGR